MATKRSSFLSLPYDARQTKAHHAPPANIKTVKPPCITDQACCNAMPATARPAPVAVTCVQQANSQTQGLAATVSHRPTLQQPPRPKHLSRHKGLSIHNKAVAYCPVQPARPGTSHALYPLNALNLTRGPPPGHTKGKAYHCNCSYTGGASQPAANPCGFLSQRNLQTRHTHSSAFRCHPYKQCTWKHECSACTDT